MEGGQMNPKEYITLTSCHIIGDIHGCYQELRQLIDKLEAKRSSRKLVFLGDITDRGYNSLACIRLVISLVNQGKALYVPGNHCDKLFRYLKGNPVRVAHGLETTVDELKRLPETDRKEIGKAFLKLVGGASSHLILDHGNLVVSHAGITERLIGKESKVARSFCLYGDADGSKHPDGRPVRRDWAKKYRGNALIVYGHTPVKEPRWLNNTVNIDQGCVFGGKLTALSYPEREIVWVDSTIDPAAVEDNPLEHNFF